MELLDTERQEMAELIARAERRVAAVRQAVGMAEQATDYATWAVYVGLARELADGKTPV